MLYIFDLGNVIVDIDFKRVLGVWSNLSGVPLATLSERFKMGKPFERHERGEISDEEFAQQLCEEMMIHLSYEQFAAGWQAIFIGLREEVIEIMQRLRKEGDRVVVLSNTNVLHTTYWPEQYPQVNESADRIYLSQELGMRKPEAEIYRYVLEQEGVASENAIFFDDNLDNIIGARALGITSIQVTDNKVIPEYFGAN
ncbi:Phosphatase yihX [Pragia fontium]|uniref:glucose-1-phosphatase n=1 Tax=Pragia fontium TaxID=82985 RepID=UPI000DFEFACD|nr:glucose-1-phosphatase [Pragia fontium]SUB80945.1 Phosphatase yihX [Pragia fontium]